MRFGAAALSEAMAQLILQNGRAAAVVGADRIFLAHHIAGLPLEHPVRRHVMAKAFYALDVADGVRRRPYTDADADRWARKLLESACRPGRRRRWVVGQFESRG
jgi:hypothetical protein